LSDEVVIYAVDSTVATITINRPERRNALTTEVLKELSAAFEAAEQEPSVRSVVITGSGRVFCAGADLGGVIPNAEGDAQFERRRLGRLFETMRGLRLPIVARVNGHALAGGLGLMLACDLVVASRDAEIGTPEASIGLWPFMVSALIQRDVPRKVALDLMLTGRRIKADEAARWGFVNRVVPLHKLDEAVSSYTQAIALKSPVAVELGKQSFYRSEGRSFDDALEYLTGMFELCLQSEDASEGISAWLQKRKPEWKGR
jgi:enoyl-CoA hydratase